MIVGKDARPIFKGAVTVYSAPLTESEVAALTPDQLRHYEKNGKVSLMVSMRDGVEMNVPGCASAIAALMTAFIRGMPFAGGPEAQHRARRSVVEQLLVLATVAFEAGEIVAEGRHQ